MKDVGWSVHGGGTDETEKGQGGREGGKEGKQTRSSRHSDSDVRVHEALAVRRDRRVLRTAVLLPLASLLPIHKTPSLNS